MTARSWDPIGNSVVYRGDARDADFEAGELWPGERIGQPLRSKSRKLRFALLVGLAAIGGGWWYYGDRIELPAWATIDTTALFASLTKTSAIATAPPAPVAEAPALPPIAIVETRTTALDMAPGVPMPQAAPSTAEAKASDESAAPSIETAKAEPLEPLPPPTVDPNDKYQVRAVSVGLHPGLSAVLLAKLSDADYRNAGTAIRKALAETADDAALIYPEQRQADLAQFKVRFVPGAGGDCRRYVVAISKAGWLTTALPMEKCAVQAAKKVARSQSLAPAPTIEINRRSP